MAGLGSRWPSVVSASYHTAMTATPNTKRPIAFPLAAAALLGACIIAGAAVHSGARGVPMPAAPEPVRVGLVDIGALMNGLDELKTRNDAVQAKGKGLQENLVALENQIKAIDAELKDMIPKDDTKRRIEKLAMRVELRATLEARGKAYQQIINLENGDILSDLYGKVQLAAAAFAQKEGLDMVLMDDRAIKLLPNLTDKEYNEIIQNKRIVYARDGMDVTERLRVTMNNEYAAGLNKPSN